MSELTLTGLRFGLLALLWLFVLGAVRVIRTDLADPGRPAAEPTRAGRPAKSAAGKRAPRRLLVTAGASRGASIPLLPAGVTIGRAATCSLVVEDDYVSNEHARLTQRGEHWIIEDCGSTNGTWLDVTKVTAPTPVPTGVPIRIGKTSLELRR